jgi:RNA polymerase sigma factor (sigma-70 family)
MSRPIAEQWALVEAHLDLGRSIARSVAANRDYLMPFDELVDQLEDAALDGLIAAASGVAPAGVPFRAWAIGCVSRKCLERVRYLSAMKRRPRRMHPLGFDPPDDRPGEDPGSPLFAELVACLSAAERQVLALRYLEDLTQVEVGGVLGISDRDVRRVETRAFERIKRIRRTEDWDSGLGNQPRLQVLNPLTKVCPVPVGTGQAKDPQTSDT